MRQGSADQQRRPRRGAVRRVALARGERTVRGFVRRSDDHRLERTVGRPLGLRMIFAAMQRRFVPSAAGDFTGDIGYELRLSSGEVRSWTVSIGADGASARPGRGRPQLTITLALADFIRLAAGELDAGRALLEGKLDLEGDFLLATQLGEMFGLPSAF